MKAMTGGTAMVEACENGSGLSSACLDNVCSQGDYGKSVVPNSALFVKLRGVRQTTPAPCVIHQAYEEEKARASDVYSTGNVNVTSSLCF